MLTAYAPRESADVRTACTRSAAFQGTALIFGEPAPYAGILTAFQRPLQAHIGNLAVAAHTLCLFDLRYGRTGVPNWEEQLGILSETRCPVTPIYANNSFNRRCRAYVPGPIGAIELLLRVAAFLRRVKR